MVAQNKTKTVPKKNIVSKTSTVKKNTKKSPLKSRTTKTKIRSVKPASTNKSTPKKQLFSRLHISLASAFAILVIIAIGSASLIRTPSVTNALSATGPITGVATKCMDNQTSKAVNGNKIQLYECNDTSAQQWTISDDGTIKVQGMCLDIPSASKAERTVVQLYKCNGTVAQKWTVNKDKTIVNPNSGLCLDDKYAGTTNGNTIWMYRCNKTIAQLWSTPQIVHTQPAPAPASKPTPAPTPAPTPKPTPAPQAGAADWVQWNTIAKPGENINTVLAKPALAGKILKLPAGVFEVSNFQTTAAIHIPANVKGIVGSGNDTIIRVKANTSTYAKSVPAQSTGQTNPLNIIKMNDGLQPQILSHFWLQGTEQGHLYNGLSIGKSKPGSSVTNLLITGIPGNSNTPPGETFGLNWWRSSDSVTRDVEIDGYRWTGNTYASRVKGVVVGSSGFGYNSHDRAKLYNVYVHDHSTGMPTFWQSNNAQTWNLKSIRNKIAINHERSFGTVHHQPVFHSSLTRRHITFNSDIGDGTLTIIGATNDTWISTTKSGPIGKGVNMLIETHAGYRGGSTIKTKPVVLFEDGKTPAPFKFIN
jgi:hypothetical protein